MTDLVNEVKDIEIEDDVQKDLGLDGQKLKTWADVHKLMLSVADQLEPSVVDRLKQKLRGVVQKKREYELIQILHQRKADAHIPRGINKLHPRDNVENAIDNQEYDLILE